MNTVIIVGIIVFGFFMGAIPTGYLVVKKYQGIDIRKFGSGNIGSTNVKRVAGAAASRMTQVVDLLKGAIPVFLAIILERVLHLPLERGALISMTGIAAILGHDFTPFLNFQGGKGVNTTVGSFLIIATVPTIIAIISYYFFRKVTRFVSVGSLALAITIPIAGYFLGVQLSILITSVLAGLLIFYRHRGNIRRLLLGEELAV